MIVETIDDKFEAAKFIGIEKPMTLKFQSYPKWLKKCLDDLDYRIFLDHGRPVDVFLGGKIRQLVALGEYIIKSGDYYFTISSRAFSRLFSPHLPDLPVDTYRWCHKCPCCGSFVEPSFNDMRYNMTHDAVNGWVIDDDVSWVCPLCGGTFSEDEVKRQPQEWTIPDNKIDVLSSLWMNSFYDPWLRWKDVIYRYSKNRQRHPGEITAEQKEEDDHE